MKLSIVTPILDSHEIVRRQLLHYGRMDPALWDEVELIWVDDGSDPPLEAEFGPLTLIRTKNSTPWAEHAARNRGVDVASGDWLFMVDLDYIIPERAIVDLLDVIRDGADKINIRRFLGVLDENGNLRKDRKTLAEWKVKPIWMRRSVPGHRSQFVMRRQVFEHLGGYREDLAGAYHGKTGGGAGQEFYFRWVALEKRLAVTVHPWRVKVYMFPCGKYCVDGDENPSGLFHNLSRDPGV